MSENGKQVLSGLRVLDFGNFITAPYAAMLLAEMGADVIKVERPGAGDPFRAFNGGHYSSHFQGHNRNKRSVAIDYTSPSAAPALEALIRQADVLVINVRPGVEEKMGLDYERIHALNPRAVYCSITGYGSSGPYADRPAYDNVGQALSGWLSMFHRGEDARVAGPAVSDAITGMFAALGILAAVHERSRTGVGRHVEVSMLESMIAFATEPLAKLFDSGQPVGFYSRGAASQSFLVTCSDGSRIGLHLSSPNKFWEGLVAAIGSPELLSRYLTRADRVLHYETLAKDLGGGFSSHPRSHWMPLLEKHDVPFAPERRLEDLAEDDQVRHLGIFYELKHAELGVVRAANRPIRFDGDNRSGFRPPPSLGEHTAEALLESGMSEEEIAHLAHDGLIPRS